MEVATTRRKTGLEPSADSCVSLIVGSFVKFGTDFPVAIESYGEGRTWYESIADGMAGG